MTGEEATATRVSQVLIVLATIGIFVFSCVSVYRAVHPVNLRPATPAGSGRPIVFDDHALQYYYGLLGSRFLAESLTMQGYDPHFMAGYPKTPIYYPSSRPYEVSLWVFSRFDPSRVFNWTVFTLLAAGPVLMYAAAWGLGLSAAERLVVAALSAVPHLLVPIADFYRYLEPAGMHSYVFASSLSVLVVALFARFARHGGVVPGAALCVTIPVLCLAHTGAIVVAAPAIALTYLVYLRRLGVAGHAVLAAIAVTTVLVNWPWLEGQLLFGHYADLRDFYTAAGRAHMAPAGGFWAPLRTHVPSPAALALLPVVFGGAGLMLWWRTRRWFLLLTVLPQIAFLFLLSFYAYPLGLSVPTPGRFTLPLGLYLFFPTAHAVVAVIGACSRAAGAAVRRPVAGHVAVAGLLAAIAVGAWLGGVPAKLWRWYSFPDIEAWQGFTRHGMALIRWLGEHTDHEGRLLHEETDRGSHQYYGSHMPALIPLYTGLELAGGPAPHALLKHNLLRFEAGTLLGQPLEQLPEDTVRRYFDLYNVRWVLCWTPQAKRYLASLEGASLVGHYDKFTLFRVGAAPSFFMEGAGRVEARENEIVLRDVAAPSGRIVLKYHWLETLRTRPARRIEPLHVPEDPVPFIAVVDPPRELAIYHDYGVGMGDWLSGRFHAAAAADGLGPASGG